MASANQVSGFLQACYSGGATIAPLIVSALLSKAGVSWYYYYYILVMFNTAHYELTLMKIDRNLGN